LTRQVTSCSSALLLCLQGLVTQCVPFSVIGTCVRAVVIKKCGLARPATMKFNVEIKSVANRVADRRLKLSLLPYKAFKKDVKRIATHLNTQNRAERMCEGECAVCMEPLGREVDTVSTACGHRFHPVCVAEALIVGKDHSCPLCRNPLQEAMPNNVDGDILRFLARLRLAAMQLVGVHNSMLQEVTNSCDHLESDDQDDVASISCIPVFSDFRMRARERKRGQAVRTLQLAVRECARWAHTNVEGLRKILKKLEKRTGMRVKVEFLQQVVVGKSIVQDFMPGIGRFHALLHKVAELEGSDEKQGDETCKLAEHLSRVVQSLVHAGVEATDEGMDNDATSVLSSVGSMQTSGDASGSSSMELDADEIADAVAPEWLLDTDEYVDVPCGSEVRASLPSEKPSKDVLIQ
jgi:hypothetical protein